MSQTAKAAIRYIATQGCAAKAAIRCRRVKLKHKSILICNEPEYFEITRNPKSEETETSFIYFL